MKSLPMFLASPPQAPSTQRLSKQVDKERERRLRLQTYDKAYAHSLAWREHAVANIRGHFGTNDPGSLLPH